MLNALMTWAAEGRATPNLSRSWSIQPIMLNGGTPAVYITATQWWLGFERKHTMVLTEEFLADADAETINEVMRGELKACVARWTADEKSAEGLQPNA